MCFNNIIQIVFIGQLIQYDNMESLSYKEANKYAAKVGLDSNVFVEGENLHYGIQMAERCVASGDAILTRFVPSETWWIFTPFRNLLHEILARVTGA